MRMSLGKQMHTCIADITDLSYTLSFKHGYMYIGVKKLPNELLTISLSNSGSITFFILMVG